LEFDEEQIALEASLRELDDFPEDNNDCSRDYELALKLSEDPDYSVDAQMALELQRQFDREHEVEVFLKSHFSHYAYYFVATIRRTTRTRQKERQKDHLVQRSI
jgi:hypothetical protein